MKIGFESVLWGQRIDDLDHMLSVIKACGYQGVELAQSTQNIYVREEGSPREIGRIENLLKRFEAHGLKLIGLVGGKLDERVEYIGDYRDLFLYIDSWPEKRQAASLLLRENPITLAVHPHWFMPIRRRRHVEELLAKVEVQCGNRATYLKVIVDTAHSVIAEDDPVEFTTIHFSRLAAVHLKDWRPDYGRWSHRYPKGFCIPGSDAGIVPVDDVMQRLSDLQYDGWVVLEQDHFAQSRERTALACAKWAQKQGKQWGLRCEPREDTVEQLGANRPPNPFRGEVGALNTLEVTRALASSPTTTSTSFYRNSAQTLRTLLKCEYVKLWGFNPEAKYFYLLSAIGISGKSVNCRSSLAISNTIAGRVASTPRVQFHDLSDPSISEFFSDSDFLNKVNSRWMICIPVFNSSNAHHMRMMISLFSDVDYRGGERLLELLAHVVSIWADYLNGEVCSAAAGATNYLCGTVKNGVIPFVDALHDHLKKMFDCENVSIFLKDASRTRLEPVGKCAELLTWGADIPPEDKCYQKGEGLTGHVWDSREMVFSSHAPNSPGHRGKAKELPESDREEVLFAPLARLNGDVLGVIRLRNKRLQPGISASTMFTDDDAAKLDAIIEAALPHLELLLEQRRRAMSLVRLNHEMQNPLNGINGATDFLREKLKRIRGSFPSGITDLKLTLGADYIEDILAYRQLMSRLALNAKLFGDTFDQLSPDFARCDLATQVVEPVARQLRPLLRKEHLPDAIFVEAFQGVIPWLYVDKLMMQQVFFNLLTNAIKYFDTRKDFRVEVQVNAIVNNKKPELYQIDVVDWGIGLDNDPQAAQRALLPFVRGSKGVKDKDPGGSGIGLSVVKDVIEKHGGTVEFVPNVLNHNLHQSGVAVNPYRKPTRFRITLPAILRNMRPHSKFHTSRIRT